MLVSYQLYSSRMQALDVTLAMLAKAGYRAVEGFGAVYEEPFRTRALLDQFGLSMPSGHIFPHTQLADAFDDTLAMARDLGMTRLFCPAPPDALRGRATAEDWTALAKTLDALAERVQGAGLRFGWHNHDWEFLPLPDGGTGMECLLAHAPRLEWEIDVAWLVRAGADPFDWIARYGDRITTAHVKDIAEAGTCLDEDGWADPGTGVMDWPGLMTALTGAEVDLFVMEHDKPSDPARFATRAMAMMQEV